MQCRHCQRVIPNGSRFCAYCGVKQARVPGRVVPFWLLPVLAVIFLALGWRLAGLVMWSGPTSDPTASMARAPGATSGRQAAVTAAPTVRLPAPVLRSPDNPTEIGIEVTFRWESGGGSLPVGYAYALLIWPDTEPNRARSGLDLAYPLVDWCQARWQETYYSVSSDWLRSQAAQSPTARILWSVIVINPNVRDAKGRCVLASDQPASFPLPVAPRR